MLKLEDVNGGAGMKATEVVKGSGVLMFGGSGGDSDKEKKSLADYKKGQTKLRLQTLEVVKYIADFIKALWDCELKSISSELSFCIAGLVAGILSTHKQMLKCVK